MFREIRNWLFLKKTVKQEIAKFDSKWHEYKLRTNWYGRIYTVVNLREEDMGDEVEVQRFKAMEMMRPMNDYLASLDFTELVYPSIESIPETRSFLIVYSPIFNKFTRRNILKYISLFLIFIGITIGAYKYFFS